MVYVDGFVTNQIRRIFIPNSGIYLTSQQSGLVVGIVGGLRVKPPFREIIFTLVIFCPPPRQLRIWSICLVACYEIVSLSWIHCILWSNALYLDPKSKIQSMCFATTMKLFPSLRSIAFFWSSVLSFALRAKIQCICLVVAMLFTTTPKILASLQ